MTITTNDTNNNVPTRVNTRYFGQVVLVVQSFPPLLFCSGFSLESKDGQETSLLRSPRLSLFIQTINVKEKGLLVSARSIRNLSVL